MTLKQAEKQASARLAIYQTELDALYRRRWNLQKAYYLLEEKYWKIPIYDAEQQSELIEKAKDIAGITEPFECPFKAQWKFKREINELAPEIERLEKTLDGMQRQYAYLQYCYA